MIILDSISDFFESKELHFNGQYESAAGAVQSGNITISRLGRSRGKRSDADATAHPT